MCRSVPQMPARSTRISTSLMPALGAGTSSSHKPGLASRLTSAFIFLFVARRVFSVQPRIGRHRLSFGLAAGRRPVSTITEWAFGIVDGEFLYARSVEQELADSIAWQLQPE